MKNKDKRNKEDKLDDTQFDIYNEDIEFDNEQQLSSEKIKKLRDKLKSCEKEKQEYLTGWQRAKADFINAKRNADEQRINLSKYAKEEFILDILPVIDSFEMALSSADIEESDKVWRKGIENIHSQLMSVLEKNDVKKFDPLGEKFDPNYHTSIAIVETSKKEEENVILDVVQTGYVLGEKIIRSPKVKVGDYQN